MADLKLDTRITRLLNIKTPVINAAMAGVAGGLLASEVTLAGGFGFLSRISGHAELQRELDIARDKLGKKKGTSEPLNVGVGFLGWILDKNDPASTGLLPLALENRVRAVWFSFGTDLRRWVDTVRRYDQGRQDGAPHTTLIFIVVNSVEEAAVAVDELKADVLVAQGIEAGGHGSATAPPVASLVSEVLHAFPQGPPVLAAGGVATGAHLAALLTLGASGAVLGTRFVLTPESTYTPAQKAAMLAAGGRATVRTMAFDELGGTTGWPPGIDGRALRNQSVKELEDGVAMDEVKRRYQEAKLLGDIDRTVVWCGSGVGLMKEIKGAGDIVRELHSEAVKHLKDAQAILNGGNV